MENLIWGHGRGYIYVSTETVGEAENWW
jgi:hypothetical protein